MGSGEEPGENPAVAFAVSLSSAAEQDLAEAFEWYEARLRGLGSEFLDCVEAAIAWARSRPGAYPVVHREVRRVLVRRFPYGLFYRIDGGVIRVIAVLDAHRNPRVWIRRV